MFSELIVFLGMSGDLMKAGWVKADAVAGRMSVKERGQWWKG